jgi:hypothetical protein
MRLVKKDLGQYKTRGEVKDLKVIQFQGLVASAHSLLEAAMISLVSEALDGNGPLGATLKKTAKDVVAKFTKQNPDYEFTVLGRQPGTKNKPDAAKTGPKTNAPTKATPKVSPKKEVPKKKETKKSKPVKKSKK